LEISELNRYSLRNARHLLQSESIVEPVAKSNESGCSKEGKKKYQDIDRQLNNDRPRSPIEVLEDEVIHMGTMKEMAGDEERGHSTHSYEQRDQSVVSSTKHKERNRKWHGHDKPRKQYEEKSREPRMAGMSHHENNPMQPVDSECGASGYRRPTDNLLDVHGSGLGFLAERTQAQRRRRLCMKGGKGGGGSTGRNSRSRSLSLVSRYRL